MMNKTLYKKLAIALLCVAYMPMNASHDDGVADVLTGVALTGAAAAGVCVLGNLLFSPSDENIIKKAEDSYDEAYDTYQPIIDRIEKVHAIDLMEASHQEKQKVIHAPSEQVLAIIAQESDLYKHSLSQAIDRLISLHKKLTRKMRRKSDAQQRYMQELAEGMDQLITQMNFLYRYAQHNADYREYCKAHALLASKYQEEIAAYNAHKIVPQVHSLVMARNRHAAFPYITYADTIECDKHKAARVMDRVASIYPHLAEHYKNLHEGLDAMHRAVINDERYAQSLKEQHAIFRQQEQAVQQRNHELALARERNKRPSYVIVEHDYLYPVEYVEYVDDYDYYDPGYVSFFMDIVV